MKFDCGETLAERDARLGEWHPWFAWHPVKIADHDCRWLETVMRKGTVRHSWDDSWMYWEYKPL
jgi:hypothetical protein